MLTAISVSALRWSAPPTTSQTLSSLESTSTPVCSYTCETCVLSKHESSRFRLLSNRFAISGTGIVVTCNEGFLPCSTCLNTPAVLVCTEAGSIDDAAMDASDVSPEWDDRTACVSVDCGVAVASHGEFSGEHYFGAPDPYSLACEAGYEAVEWTLVQEARCAGGSGAALLSSRQECEDTDNNWADSSADGVDNPICTAADGTTAIASRTTEGDDLRPVHRLSHQSVTACIWPS